MTGRLNNTNYRLDGQKKKVDALWINLLEGKNLVNPILEKYQIDNYAKYIVKDNGNRTEAIRNEIDLIDLYETDFKRIVVDRITNFDISLDEFSIKLHPIDSNLKKVSSQFPFSVFC